MSANKKHDIVVLGKSFPIKVTEKEATMLDDVQKDLNERLSNIKRHYSKVSNEDCLSMALISYAFERRNDEIKAHNLEAQIKDIERALQLL